MSSPVAEKSNGPAVNLPNWVNQVLASCPSAGTGVHSWLFVAALKLHRAIPEERALQEALTDATANCGRYVPESEIRNAIVNSKKPVGQGVNLAGPRWPKPNDQKILEIVQEGGGLQGLQADSPIAGNAIPPDTEQFIDILFPGDPLLCAGPRKERAVTRPRKEWRGFLGKQQFIVPSSMTAVYGRTRDGRESMRTLENAGPRRFLIVEFDQGSFEEHAALLKHLSGFAPLVAVVHSGNKSLHGWFFCEGKLEEVVHRFFRYAVSLGADPTTWTPCQFVRMPEGLRDNGALQRVVYFNPTSLEVK